MHQSSIRNESRPQTASALSDDAAVSAECCGEVETALANPADSLQGIVSDIECFLDRWMQRFDHLLRHCRDQVEHDSEMRRRMAEFDQQCRQWEEQRQRETQQLHEKAEQLTEAWLQLEQEQRSVLQAQAALKQRGRQTQSSPAAAARSRGNTCDENRGSVAGAPPAADRTISSGLSQLAAVQQFELLKHEIGNHTPTAR